MCLVAWAGLRLSVMHGLACLHVVTPASSKFAASMPCPTDVCRTVLWHWKELSRVKWEHTGLMLRYTSPSQRCMPALW